MPIISELKRVRQKDSKFEPYSEFNVIVKVSLVV